MQKIIKSFNGSYRNSEQSMASFLPYLSNANTASSSIPAATYSLFLSPPQSSSLSTWNYPSILNFCAESLKKYPLHLPLHILVKKLMVVSLFCLVILVLSKLSHLLSTYICIFMRHLHHHSLPLNLTSFSLVDKLFILNPLIFNLECIHLILLLDNLRRNNTIFPLGFDPTRLQDNTLMMLLNKRLSFLK